MIYDLGALGIVARRSLLPSGPSSDEAGNLVNTSNQQPGEYVESKKIPLLNQGNKCPS